MFCIVSAYNVKNIYLQCGRRDTRKAVINLKPVMFPAQKEQQLTSGKEDYGQMNSTQIYLSYNVENSWYEQSRALVDPLRIGLSPTTVQLL